MKKVILTSILLANSFSSFAEDSVESLAPESVTVDGGKINFTGSIVAAPCAVDNSTDGQMVRLGQVAANQLASKGSTSSAVPFSIKLVGCDLSPLSGDTTATGNYTKASITFSGSSTDATTLALSGTGAGEYVARNVGIQIFQANKAVNVDGTSSTLSENIIAGENEIPFTASYVATDAEVTAGIANSSVDFKVSYE